MFETWVCRKNSLGFATKTHYEFAMYLLLNFCQEERDECDFLQSPVDGKPFPFLFVLFLIFMCIIACIFTLFSKYFAQMVTVLPTIRYIRHLVLPHAYSPIYSILSVPIKYFQNGERFHINKSRIWNV